MNSAELITFSPIHIGDGEELISFEYIEEGNKIKVYPFYYLSTQLYKTYETKELLPKIQILKDFAKAGLSYNLKEYFELAKVEIPPKYELESFVDINGNRIKTFIKNINSPYIPGSEIKGALRTVFLYGILKENEELKKEFIKELEIQIKETAKQPNIKERRKKIEKFISSFETRIFRPDFKPYLKENPKEKPRDAQYDLFKGLIISDSENIDYEKFYVGMVKVLNSSRDIKDYCEVLKENQRISLKCSIDENFALQGLKWVSKFEKKLTNKNIEKMTWEFLKRSAIQFYSKLIEFEKKFVNEKIKEQEIKSSLQEKLNKISELLKQIANTSKVLIPLRIGRYQGYLSLTIMHLVKEEREDLFKKVFEISVPQARKEINKTRTILITNSKPDSKPEYNFLGWSFLHIKI